AAARQVRAGGFRTGRARARDRPRGGVVHRFLGHARNHRDGTAGPGTRRRAIVGRLPDGDSATATLLTSELVTNAVIHPGQTVGGSVGLRITAFSDRIRVEVTDAGSGFDPGSLRPSEPREPGGHGLIVVDGLSSRWGT